jgi:hypothetical protein
MRAVPLMLSLCVFACATPESEGKGASVGSAPETFAPIPSPLPSGPPDQIAKTVHRAGECENLARQYFAADANRGWAVLRACVDKGDFTALRVLLSPPWLTEMKHRDDAPEVIAAVMAARGGDVTSDMEFVRKNRILLFDLAMASKAGDRLNGRNVVFLAHVADGKPKQSGYALELAELGIYAEFVGEHPINGVVQKHITTHRVDGNLQTSGVLGSGNVHGTMHTESTSGTFKRFYENTAEETGRMIWAAADMKDPFLVPGRDLVVLAKLDGIKDLTEPSEQEEPDQRFLVRIEKYWEPSRAMVFRE